MKGKLEANLCAGSKITLVGLKRNGAALNGFKGRCINFENEVGRWVVKLDAGNMIRVLPENLWQHGIASGEFLAPSPEPAEAEITKPNDGEKPTEETKEGDANDEKKPMEEEKADVKEEEVEKKADEWPTSNWWEKGENVKEEEKAAQPKTPKPAVE